MSQIAEKYKIFYIKCKKYNNFVLIFLFRYTFRTYLQYNTLQFGINLHLKT